MSHEKKKVAVLFESDFYEHEIWYYRYRFEEQDVDLHFLTRLWGQSEIQFKGHEYHAPMKCDRSFEGMSDDELRSYAAVIVPSGMVADRLRYVTDKERRDGFLPPATQFLQRAFAEKNIVKGLICHALWLVAPAKELVEGRKLTCHNNLLGDARNMGAIYVDQDVVIDSDLITGRTGDHAGHFARAIIRAIT
jgi:protease I